MSIKVQIEERCPEYVTLGELAVGGVFRTNDAGNIFQRVVDPGHKGPRHMVCVNCIATGELEWMAANERVMELEGTLTVWEKQS